jgi:hypothetical protein
MIAQLLQRFTQRDLAWKDCIEILAALPENH